MKVVGQELGWPEEGLAAETVSADGPGNVLILAVESEHVTEVFTGFGRRGLPAESVARRAAEEVRQYLDTGVAVGAHLADQLLLPFTQTGGGSFLTLLPTTHFNTNLDVLSRFFEFETAATPVGKQSLMIEYKST
jgi:RNA 3'-terminal phosphate cyclase (ATP)